MASPHLDLERCLSIFLVDWDDTLLPTSDLKRDPALSGGAARCPRGHDLRCFVNGSGQPPCFCDDCGVKPARGAKMFGCRQCNFDSCARCANRVGREALATIDDRAASVLEAACATPNGHVTLLTNASLDWLWSSAETFLPKVHAIFSSGRLSVVSAYHAPPALALDRSSEEFGRAEVEYKNSSANWKAQAVRNIAVDVQQVIDQQHPDVVQVLSVGDMPHDMEAGHALAALLTSSMTEEVLVKTVRMDQAPAVTRLADELKALCNTLPSIVRCGENMASSMCVGPCAL